MSLDGYKQIADHMIKIDWEERRIWEEKLTLYIRPRRWWMPKWIWARLLDFVLLQTTERVR